MNLFNEFLISMLMCFSKFEYLAWWCAEWERELSRVLKPEFIFIPLETLFYISSSSSPFLFYINSILVTMTRTSRSTYLLSSILDGIFSTPSRALWVPLFTSNVITRVRILPCFSRGDDGPRKSNWVGEDDGLKQKKQIEVKQFSFQAITSFLIRRSMNRIQFLFNKDLFLNIKWFRILLDQKDQL